MNQRMHTRVKEAQEAVLVAPVPQGTEFVDSVDRCSEVCAEIVARAGACESGAYSNVVALDLEGENLGASGTVCIVTMATEHHVYLFDICAMGADAFDQGRLKNVIEDTRIMKLFFDCRADTAAMFFLYGVRPQNVCDLQVLACLTLSPRGNYVIGLLKAFQALALFNDEDQRVKEVGGERFNPEKGGSYSVWRERPLDELMVRYCAADVKYFFVAHYLMKQFERRGLDVGMRRANTVCQRGFFKSKENAVRDF
jgi:exonuclease 3'-5' domain-containing protein 1